MNSTFKVVISYIFRIRFASVSSHDALPTSHNFSTSNHSLPLNSSSFLLLKYLNPLSTHMQ
ncbi:hypothetical protein Hdeb2414_s0007g00251561 [Helianthus debilis subsp. tardiflorus]